MKTNPSQFLILFFFILSVPVLAQKNVSWGEYLEFLYENNENSAVPFQEAYDHLSELASQPIDINTAETEDFLQIPGLNINQISDIIEFREKYGAIKDIHEISLIPSIDDRLRDYLYAFLYVENTDFKEWYSREEFKKKLKHLNHRILLTGSFPTYSQEESYLGDNTSHSLRYTVGMGENAKFNITGSKSIGEPFFSNNNKYGYDLYTYNLSVRRLGIFKQIILGTFRGQFGMGLTMNNTFALSKQNMLSAIGRLTNTFSPYSGTSDSKYFQGGAFTMSPSQNFSLSTFVSYRYADATLNADSTISTILTTGYHRTKTEIEKKNNVKIFTTGVHIKYGNVTHYGMEWGVGSSIVYTHFSDVLNPIYSKSGVLSNSQLYRFYYPSGKNTYNIGLDYRLRWRGLTITGETALSGRSDNTSYGGNKKGGTPLATLNTLVWRLSGKTSLVAVQRYYSYEYQSFYGKAFGENSNVTNESGVYGGLRFLPFQRLIIDVYTDYAYFPWYRYHKNAGTYAWDNCIQGSFDLGKQWTMSVRYRFKTKDNNNQRLRILASFRGEKLNLRSHIEGTFVTDNSEKENGFIISQSVSYNLHPRWTIYGMVAYYDTDDYTTRLYAYEQGMMYKLSYPSYWGRGFHGMMMVKSSLTSWLTAIAKISTTHNIATFTVPSQNKTMIEAQLQVRL